MKTTLKIALMAAALGFASASSAGPLLHLVASETKTELKAMEGKRVLGTSGELLGVIEKVDEQAKMADLNASDVESAMRMIAGTARSMGLEVID